MTRINSNLRARASGRSLETLSATEAAAVLGLSRERLRQMAVARELPERVADSSRFRPRYVRSEIEAFGRATGRIALSGAVVPMRLVVEELVLAPPDRLVERRLPVHLRVWERAGWPPVVVIGALLDGDRTIQIHSEAWQERVREAYLGGAKEVRWVELWPDYRTSSQRNQEPAFREVRRGGEYLSFARRHRRERLVWVESSQSAIEEWVGGAITPIPPAVYRVGVVERVLAAAGDPVIVEWDPWEFRPLAAAIIDAAKAAPRLLPADRELALDVACFAACAARLVEDRTSKWAPASMSAVTIEPARLADALWREIEQVAALDRMRVDESESLRERARALRAVRDGVERMRAERGDEMPWRLRESITRLRAFLPNPGLDEEIEAFDVR